MATVVLKLFAGQGSVTDGQTDGQSSDYNYASTFGEHKNDFF